MVKTIVAARDFWVTIDAFDSNGDSPFSKTLDNLTFEQAADYFEHAVNYFKFSLLENQDWFSIQIEVNAPYGVVQVVEIKH